MQSYGDLNVFCFDKRWLTLNDMLAWAEYSGCITATLEHLQFTEEVIQDGFDVDQDKLQSEVNDFRYKQNLITTQETHEWLKERALALDDLYTYIHRKLANPRRSLRLTIAAWKRRCDDPAREMWTELHFSGSFTNLVDDFICRVAIADMKNALDDPSPLPIKPNNPNEVFHGDKTRFVETWEALYQDFCSEVAGRDSCEQRLKMHRHELLKVKYEAVSYKNLNAAKEAFCCIRYDGESVESVAGRTNAPFESDYTFIEDLPKTLQQKMFSAHAQECLEPIRTSPQKGYTVYVMLRKTEPHPNNSEVRERLQRKIVHERLERNITEKLQWIPWQPGELT